MTELPRRARLLDIACWVTIAAIAVATRWRWSQLVGAHTPFTGWDTQVFQQIAELPLGPGLLVSSKPLVVPLVFRAAHNDSLRIIGFQAELAFWAWAIWTASTVLAVRRRWVRVLVAATGAAFLLEPARVGFTGSLMPESVNDSLTALCAAGAIAVARLTGRARLAAAAGTAVAAIAWLFTRDTNAFIALTAVPLAMWIWRGWRSRAAWGLAAAAVAITVVVLYTARVAHEPLPYQARWPRPFTARIWYPMLNNLILRVQPTTPDAVSPALHPFHDSMDVMLAGPEAGPLHRWLEQQGPSVYAHWLLQHPLARLLEVVKHRRSLLTRSLSPYMPGHWVGPSGPSFRTWTTSWWPLWLLMIASPLLLLRPRQDPLRGVALCATVGAVVGIMASYYGDATEPTRHCYGAAQQLILGLHVALIAGLDRLRRRPEDRTGPAAAPAATAWARRRGPPPTPGPRTS